MTPTAVDLAGAGRLSGIELGPSGWLRLEQERLERFARATGEAAGPRVPPMLLVSLAVRLRQELLRVDGVRTTVNYGLDALRVHGDAVVGDRIRLRAAVEEAAEAPGGLQLVIAHVVEGAGSRPVLSWRGIQRLLR